MRIDAFLHESPMFAVGSAARRFEALSARALSADGLSFFEGLTLSALFFEAPRAVKPSHMAEAFGTTRGNVSHCVSTLEARGLLQRKIDPDDARAYQLTLSPQGKRCALRVISTLDKLQHGFEQQIGKTALRDTLRNIRKMAALG
jgi:DNA-binding MarR family transcriptional regulator